MQRLSDISFRHILLRTIPYSLLEPGDLRAVSKHLGLGALQVFKEYHFQGAAAWLQHWERSFNSPSAGDAIAALCTANLRAGIAERKNGVVRRLVMHLAESVFATYPVREFATGGIDGLRAQRADGDRCPNNSAFSDKARIERARRELRERYIAVLPGVVARFCYFADSYCVVAHRYQDLSLASRFGDEAVDIVQQEAFFEALIPFLEAPMSRLISESRTDDQASVWLSVRVLEACYSMLPLPIALLASSKIEALLRFSRNQPPA